MATKKVAKKSAKTTKPEAKAKGKLSPLEQYRLDKKNGVVKKKKGATGKKKTGLPVFKAPAEFKPFFAKTLVRVGKDGLVTDMKVVRIKGSPTNENAKTVDMAAHDPQTLVKVAARYAGAAFVRNEGKRLPANSAIQFLMRVGVKKDTGALTVALKDFKLRDLATKKTKALDKKSPIYRLARKPTRYMPAAFTQVKEFPSAAELKELNASSDEEVTSKVTKKSKKNKK